MNIQNFLQRIWYQYIKKRRPQTVRIASKIRKSQKRFLAEHGAQYVYPPDKFSEITHTFNPPYILEIGFGNGDHIIQLAVAHPDKTIIGVELYPLGIARSMKIAHQKQLKNICVVQGDVRDVLDHVRPNSLQRVYILYPDPWRKKKHYKRRLVNSEFVRDVMKLITPGGECVLATDWESYAEQMSEIVNNYKTTCEYLPADMSTSDNNDTTHILHTSFAQRAQREGRPTWIFRITKK